MLSFFGFVDTGFSDTGSSETNIFTEVNITGGTDRCFVNTDAYFTNGTVYIYYSEPTSNGLVNGIDHLPSEDENRRRIEECGRTGHIFELITHPEFFPYPQSGTPSRVIAHMPCDTVDTFNSFHYAINQYYFCSLCSHIQCVDCYNNFHYGNNN